MTDLDTAPAPVRPGVARSRFGRLLEGQTAIDFVGRRYVTLGASGIFILVTIVSLAFQGLNLGIDFEGGISWDVPAESFTVDDARSVLEANGLDADNARIQERSSETGDFVKVQVADQPTDVATGVRADLAEAAGVEPNEISTSLVSSTWGSEITEKALRALVIFLVLVMIFISIRFEWRMALSAIVAMLHDVVISVGIYSLFQFVVTPSTVIAFLTILGYSLYDTIVVFDRIRENEARFAATKAPYDDILNVSVNQVLMRSLMTSVSSIIPVVSLLVIGAGVLGQSTLAEFGVALLVGMITGVYSSLFVAAPLLDILKRLDKAWQARTMPRATGEALREMVISGSIGGGRRSRPAPSASGAATGVSSVAIAATVTTAEADTPERAAAALTHPPRPRKKKRR